MLKKDVFTGLFWLHIVVLLAYISNVTGDGSSNGNPFTPKSYLRRYLKTQIRNSLPEPSFLLSMASPLSAPDSAAFTKLAAANALDSKLAPFCAAANLLCFSDLSPSLEKHTEDAGFAVYAENKNFSNYGTSRLGGADSFKNYSKDVNLPIDGFLRYGRDSVKRNTNFGSYGEDTNVVSQDFNGYGVAAVGSSSDFIGYNRKANVPGLTFGVYSTEGNGVKSGFIGYTEETNSGQESFTTYSRNGNDNPETFTGYGKSSNVITSDFSNYGQSGNTGNGSFISYGFDGNVPQNKFTGYDQDGNAGTLSFASYRDQANVGDDTFQSYAKKSNAETLGFTNYGQSFNEGSDTFTGYGKGAKNPKVGFEVYGVNSTFMVYEDKKAASFAKYTKRRSSISATMAASSSSFSTKFGAGPDGKPVNKWVVLGKFFRESMLQEKSVMPMPDITDKMPKRSFLPRSISSKLPFSTSKLAELKRIFHAADNSTMEGMIADTLAECEREPSLGESKRCVGSGEDMIDFATSILGRNIAVKTTESVAGSNQNIMIGSIKRVEGGKTTQSVSCHQSLFPYLVYYCHSVPKVRVYEADLLDPKTEKKINHGIAICHIDTSAWSATHGAFLALGSSPGRIEVCHWIFENDMTWTRVD